MFVVGSEIKAMFGYQWEVFWLRLQEVDYSC